MSTKRLSRLRNLFLSAVALLLLVGAARAEIVIVLKNKFIDQYKDRATIDADFIVDKAHEKPNAASKDGDLHVAGRSKQVELAVVAEIMNAKFDKQAVQMIHDAEGEDEPVKMTGAWRIWCEHGGDSEQIQGKPLKPFKSTNPDHIFEIHPVTRLGKRSLLPTLKPIKGFKYKDAEQAFVGRYEKTKCELIPDPAAGTTTIVTTASGYNYVKFKIEPNGAIQELKDGSRVMARVFDLEDELLVRNRRMVFVKGSAAEKALKLLKKGDRMTVLGIPRVNLSLVRWRIDNAGERPEVLKWSLPYEMIIVAVFDEDAEDD